MNLRRPWLLGKLRRTAVVGVLATWALALCVSANGPLAWQGGTAARLHAEQATPDCDNDPADPHPGRQRLKLFRQLGVDGWHAAGFRGKGVKIAILDTGFRGYRQHLGKALPAHVTVRSFRHDGNLEARDSQHGILCGEVLHALAPEAELLLANWDTDSPERFLDAVRWARKQGARVISCSIIMPSWSDGEGGGYVNESLADIAGPGNQHGDLLCFASAGNTAQRHWCGSYRGSKDGWHLWKSGDHANGINPWGNDRVSVEIYWQRGEEDYELVVTDDRGEPIGQKTSHCGRDRCSRTVHFRPDAANRYQAHVRLAKGEGGPFHLVVLGGGLDEACSRGSIACPADGPAALAVGAVHDDGCRASYSSCGPNSRCPKPDFMAPVPFPSQWRSRPFTGTSAAAPQAAALAALWMSRHPGWTAQQVRNALRTGARDLGPPGHDHETGYGLIQLPQENLSKK